MSNGSRANRTGKSHEIFIDGWLDDLGYTEVSQQNFFNLRCLNQPIYAYQCWTGRSIYNKKRKVDFILYHPVRWTDALVIQSK